MNLKVFYYYRLPHPLRRGENIIVSDSRKRAALRNAAWEFCRGSALLRPKILRFLISPDRAGDDRFGDDYFKSLKQKEDRDFNKAKLKVCMKFLGSILVGYILYLAPPSFWGPIETVFDSLAHGLSDYAKWWIILIFPVKGLIKNFGTGVQFPLPPGITGNPVFRRIPLLGRIRKIGVEGRWQIINRTAGSTKLYPLLDKNLAEEFSDDLKKCITNIKKKSENAESLIARFKELSEKLLSDYPNMDSDDFDSWNRDYLDFLEEATKSSSAGDFPWGEIPKLDRFLQDLAYFGGLNRFIFAPAREIYPDAEIDYPSVPASSLGEPHIIDLNLRIRTVSALKQSRNLKKFFADPQVCAIRDRIYSDFERLNEAATSGEAVMTLDSLSGAFARLRDFIGFFHMGANFMIPHEKGRELPDFYHKLYLIFGRASCDIAAGYKRAFWGLRPLLTLRSVRLRIGEAADEAFELIENRKLRRAGRIKDGLASFIGKSAAAGFALSALLLFLFGSIFSFYTLGPDETAVLNTVRIGYMEEFLNNEVSAREYGSGLPIPGSVRELYWHLPPPLTRMQRISLSEPSEMTVHMIIGESYTNNPWKKFLQAMSGQLGMSFDVAELTFEYLPRASETWKNYDADGKGYRRLIRDTSSIIEEWKTSVISSFEGGITSINDSNEVNYIFTTYFRELSRKGVIENYIRRSFSQTALSTHVYYGSPLERYEPGFITVIDELDRRYEEYGKDPFLDNDEKAELQNSMRGAREVVEETLKRIEDQVALEYGDLRRHPDKLRDFVKDPYQHLQELRDFETLWSGIQSYTWHLYNQEKMKEIFSSGRSEVSGILSGSGEKDYIQGIISAVNNDPHLSKLIRVEAVKYKVRDMGVAKLNLIQQKWKDII